MPRRLIKALHEFGAIGTMGSLVVCLAIVIATPAEPTAGYAAVRAALAVVARWLLLPSLILVLASGMLAMMANRAFMDAGWAWLKTLMGITMFEGTLLTISGTGRRAAELTAAAVGGGGDPAELAALLRAERGGLWLLLALCAANVALAVWRPRLTRRRR